MNAQTSTPRAPRTMRANAEAVSIDAVAKMIDSAITAERDGESMILKSAAALFSTVNDRDLYVAYAYKDPALDKAGRMQFLDNICRRSETYRKLEADIKARKEQYKGKPSNDPLLTDYAARINAARRTAERAALCAAYLMTVDHTGVALVKGAMQVTMKDGVVDRMGATMLLKTATAMFRKPRVKAQNGSAGSTASASNTASNTANNPNSPSNPNSPAHLVTRAPIAELADELNTRLTKLCEDGYPPKLNDATAQMLLNLAANLSLVFGDKDAQKAKLAKIERKAS